jgi:hypothetical protein
MKMAKMPMVKDPKTGKMVPSFAMDGEGPRDLKKAAKGGAIKMRGGGMAAKGMAKGGAVMAKGGAVKMRGGGMAKGYNIGGAIDKLENKKTAKGMAKGMAKGGAVKPMAKGGAVKMRGGGMAKGYKIGGKVATKGGTKGGVSGGTKVTRADGIAKRGKTKGRKV